MAFKRASLSGSAQLFQPTRVPPSEATADAPEPSEFAMDRRDREPQLVTEALPSAPPQGHLYRLSEDDLELLLAALQHAKFPHSYQRLPKPPLEEFEALEALRQKLTQQRGERV